MLVRMARLAGKMKAAATPMRARVGDQRAGRVRRRRRRREHAEEDEADLHGALAAEAVPDAAAGQQQAGEGEAVGVDDPLQRGDRGAEMRLSVGSATLTIVLSTTTRNTLRHRTGRISQRRSLGSGRPAPPVPGRLVVVSSVVPPISAPSERLL